VSPRSTVSHVAPRNTAPTAVFAQSSGVNRETMVTNAVVVSATMSA
jgi:hypothetical protein